MAASSRRAQRRAGVRRARAGAISQCAAPPILAPLRTGPSRAPTSPLRRARIFNPAPRKMFRNLTDHNGDGTLSAERGRKDFFEGTGRGGHTGGVSISSSRDASGGRRFSIDPRAGPPIGLNAVRPFQARGGRGRNDRAPPRKARAIGASAQIRPNRPVTGHRYRMSPVGGRPDVARGWPELLLLAKHRHWPSVA